MELPKTITKEEFLESINIDEVFCTIEEFLQNWILEYTKEQKKVYGVGYYDYEEERKKLYNFLPTDKQKLKIIEKMIKANN